MGSNAGLVPFASKLDQVYPDSNPEKVRLRWDSLLQMFQSHYNSKPDLVARSPGRVNLIGEHVDYSLYGVLPMAVCVDSLIAIRAIAPEPGTAEINVQICNVNAQKFASQKLAVPSEGPIAIDASKHLWTNYFMAGLIGSMDLLRKRIPDFRPSSMQVLVDGTVPAGGGLSSSAAFVCASALAVLNAHKCEVSQEDLFEIAIVSERLVGVNSGGMDQAASIFARAHSAMDTSFYPNLNIEYVDFPDTEPKITFLVAQTFVAADKHVTAPMCYNLRVVECTLAAAVLATKHGIPLKKDQSPLGYSLRTMQETLQSLQKMVDITKRFLFQKNGYTREEIATILGISVDELELQYMSTFPIKAERFLLQQRALHVFSEAHRVLEFRNALSKPGSHRNLQKLGNLMNQSHASCRDLYDCSCPELDQLCQIALEAGSLGSRLTGAGWGGCSVHLVLSDKVDSVIGAWKSMYYSKLSPSLSQEQIGEAVVTSTPSTGAFVISPSAS